MNDKQSVDEITEFLRQINLENSISKEIQFLNSDEDEMAQPQETPINYQLLRLYIEHIPNFSGDSHILGIFIESCDTLIRTYTNRSNPNDPVNTFLLKAIIGKLTGRALVLIGSRTELTTWQEIKNVLNLTFGDNRNLDCLVQDLLIMKPEKSEPAVRFGARIQDARSLIYSKINISNFTPQQKLLHLQNYEGLALKTFIRGLSGRLQDIIRIRNPPTLEEAISLVIEEENFLYAQNQSRLFSHQSNSTYHLNPFVTKRVDHPFRQTTSKPPQQNFSQPYGYQNSYQQNQPSKNPQQNYFQQQQPFKNPQQNYFQQHNPFQMKNYSQLPNSQPKFPTGPVNIQSRPNPQQQRFFTNQQVFGTPPKPVNVFKPTGYSPQQRPTPMSGVSTIVSKPKNFNNQVNNLESYDSELTEDDFYYQPDNDYEQTENINFGVETENQDNFQELEYPYQDFQTSLPPPNST